MAEAYDVLTSVENQRRRLGVDAIDLYQIHWPACWHNTPICETMKTLEELVNKGLVRYIGVSNFPVQLLDYARTCLSRTDIVTSQNRYNLVGREADKELLPHLRREGIVPIAWSPLAKGVLTGKYTPENPPAFEDVRRNDPLFMPHNLKLACPLVEEIRRLAAAYGKTPAQVALNWLVRDPWTPSPALRRLSRRWRTQAQRAECFQTTTGGSSTDSAGRSRRK